MAGLQQGLRKFLYACTDIEGHSGLDGRHYVLDFARVFPPTFSINVTHTFLYQLMRPEVREIEGEREEVDRAREKLQYLERYKRRKTVMKEREYRETHIVSLSVCQAMALSSELGRLLAIRRGG
jgi:hypothetical protein